MTRRAFAFVSVGAAGFVVQLATLSALWHWLHVPVAVATALAVEAAILVNFCWHERWTWRDRFDGTRRFERLGRFHLANGMTSLVGNVVITELGVRLFGLTPALSNVVAVILLAAINFVAADRVVFSDRAGIAALVFLVLLSSSAAAAELQPATLKAWNQHVAAIEASLPQHEKDAPVAQPEGRTIGLPGGTLHEWRGSIVVRHATVGALVEALINPGTPPPQDDVVESRVLEHQGDSLRVYLKLVRTAIVTVTYDTEHAVRFDRRTPGFVTSRSVATRIVEAGGDDHGFLWKLNSYWRYRQVGDDVQVDVLSISLSRAVPTLVKPVAAPIVSRVARESMVRTLDAVKRFGESLPAERSQRPASALTATPASASPVRSRSAR